MLDVPRTLLAQINGHANANTPPKQKTTYQPPPSAKSSSFNPPVALAANSRPRRTAMLSSQNTNYKQLEGGMGAGRTRGGRRFGWKKFAIGAAVIIVLIWLAGPRWSEQLSWSWKEDKPDTYVHDESEATSPPVLDPPAAKPPKLTTDLDEIRPTSFETDPDPSRTVYCTTPHKPTSPLVQYAIMIDAGSTGSRIHIYKFHNCGPYPTYEYETFKMTQPGLAMYAGRPGKAAKSLDVLLDEAVRVVPAGLRKCTPLAVKATAGLRLLGTTQSNEILEKVKERLEKEYPFQVQEKDGVVVMDGKDEGVYAWITANYLLKTIRADSPEDTPTYAVLDLGGASTQIIFEPVFSKPDSSLVEGEHKYDLVFGGKKHVLYQHSYLGYGLMLARMHVHMLVEFMASLRSSASTDGPIPNPCLARGTRREVEIEATRKKVVMAGEDIGGLEACNRVMELVLAKDAICELKPCSFNGVYQPSLLDAFPSGKVLLLSYFYDRVYPLLPKDVPPSRLTVDTLSSLAKDVCLGKAAWEPRWGHDSDLMEELEGRPEWCLDLTFMHALLRLGYEFGDEREVMVGKKVDGTELGWCLGATLAMIGGELKCRI